MQGRRFSIEPGRDGFFVLCALSIANSGAGADTANAAATDQNTKKDKSYA